jgi:hypothetical protein
MAWALLIFAIDAAGLALFWFRLTWRKLEGKGWAFMLSSLSGGLACTLTYNYSERYRAFGFPLPAAAFDGGGLDYVSPLTPIILGLDFVLIGAIPWALLVFANLRQPGGPR